MEIGVRHRNTLQIVVYSASKSGIATIRIQETGQDFHQCHTTFFSRIKPLTGIQVGFESYLQALRIHWWRESGQIPERGRQQPYDREQVQQVSG